MRAVVYCRVSTPDQAGDDKVSIPDQISWAREFASSKGWDFIKEYIEPGLVGDTEIENREAMSRLLNEASHGLFDIVLVAHSSRLAREVDIGLKVIRLLGQKKVQVYIRNTPTEVVDPQNFTWGLNVGAQYMTALSFIGDQQENVARGERVRSGSLGLAKRGILRTAPYGYKKVKEINSENKLVWRFVEDIYKADVVRRIFNQYNISTGSIRKIMLALNQEGVASPNGKVSLDAWTAPTIRNILRNPAYIGKVRWGRKLGGKYTQGKTENGKQKRVNASKDKIVIVNGTHPKLITEELFDATQKKLDIRGEIKGRAASSPALLAGLLVCSRCGKNGFCKRRRLKKNNKDRFDYVCSSYFISKTCQRHLMTANKLHRIVLSELMKLASDSKFRDKLLFSSQKFKVVGDKEDLSRLENENLDLQRKQRRLLDAYEEGMLSLVEYGAEKTILDKKISNVNNRLIELKDELSNTEFIQGKRDQFLNQLQGLSSLITTSDEGKQKQLVMNLIKRVYVSSNSVKLEFRL